jgi:signal transduction histidine kinase
MAQVREQQNILTEALANSNRDLASLQQQLVRAKSLAQLGEMAAGAAHEMNNPLAVVCGRAQLLASKLSEAALKQDALLIAQQGERLSQIITDLMDFAKPAAPRIASTSLPDLVDGAVADATQRAALATPIHVRVEPSGDMPPVSVDARQVRAAVSEVVLNALQATSAAQGRAPAPTEVLIQIRYDTLDEQAIVQVSDHGVGMTEETMKQAFAPFFSAKTAGRNRGMGLPKALRWVELHGGTIRLDSIAGSGTTAVIIVPQAKAEAAPTPESPADALRM